MPVNYRSANPILDPESSLSGCCKCVPAVNYTGYKEKGLKIAHQMTYKYQSCKK